MIAVKCPICDEIVTGSGPSDLDWSLYDHIHIDHRLSEQEADAYIEESSDG